MQRVRINQDVITLQVGAVDLNEAITMWALRKAGLQEADHITVTHNVSVVPQIPIPQFPVGAHSAPAQPPGTARIVVDFTKEPKHEVLEGRIIGGNAYRAGLTD